MSALTKEIRDYEYEGQKQNNKNKKGIKKKKKNKLNSIKNIIILLIPFAFCLFVINNLSVITDKRTEISEIEESILLLNNEIDKCNIALESNKNANKIEEIAKTYLGMNYPTRKQTVFIDVADSDNTEEATSKDTANKNDENKAESAEEKPNNMRSQILGFVNKVIQVVK